MSKTTANLGLIKPERSDNYSVDVMSNNMDIIDTKITQLEAGEFETINAGEIKANLSPSMNLTSASGEISAIKLLTSVALVNARHDTNAGNTGGGTFTYTYKENPISNDVVFVLATSGSSMHSKSSTAYLKINNVEVCRADSNGSNSYRAVSNTHSTTLKSGDIVTVYGSAGTSNGLYATVTLTCEGYLTN